MIKPYQRVLEFWFEELTPKDWWRKDTALDARIRSEFGALHDSVSRGETSDWRETDSGRLAEIIVLDQFSRNMFRDQACAFSYDGLARDRARAAVAAGVLERLQENRRSFVLMPFMHSEELEDHRFALPLFQQYCSANTLDFEKRHAAIIERFGRYPHRNAVLGRASSTEELEFLSRPGSSF